MYINYEIMKAYHNLFVIYNAYGASKSLIIPRPKPFGLKPRHESTIMLSNPKVAAINP